MTEQEVIREVSGFMSLWEVVMTIVLPIVVMVIAHRLKQIVELLETKQEVE